MIWEKDGTSMEIRTQGELDDGRPALDEIVAKSAFVHLEQMAHDHWWMGIEGGGKYFHLNFGVKDGLLWVQLSDQGEDGEEWEGEQSRDAAARNRSTGVRWRLKMLTIG
jgi:hypothetical protein